MNFYDWMIYRGLSESSAKSYDRALRGALSKWAMDSGLTSGPLIALTSSSALAALSPSIQKLPVFKERNARGHHMYSATLSQFAAYLASNGSDDMQADLEQIISDPNTTATEKTALIKSRIGQGAFRDKVLLHWTSCAVTGFNDTSLLVASHIKPWKKSTNSERLDQWNGLLLSPNLDKAFDKGFITFEMDGSIRLSPLFIEATKLGITSDMKIALKPDHEKYMAHHRTEEFKGG
ncbi:MULTISPECIES: HNH endonuclease [unclassified Delftia]|uniref:HNH endonuclease n=1 Tax=unclassified Delftia TaxID=2613839 RepID=UPI0018FF5C85|nr:MULTISPECIES: HNH endonuclease signature motif containing protein [unclassified Delftia]MBK0115439.1 HNH endonuclease [Delftia sp. S65]MBK0121703.1 HNH endonuclease [Delftia sp. S67]MBK0133730.1 HNH endonuclease [Delftia sp. S66]